MAKKKQLDRIRMGREEGILYDRYLMDRAILRNQMVTARGEGFIEGRDKGYIEGRDKGYKEGRGEGLSFDIDHFFPTIRIDSNEHHDRPATDRQAHCSAALGRRG